MTDRQRTESNLTDYFMRCSSYELARHAHLLGCELVARGLRGDALAFDLSRTLQRQPSPPRAEPYSRASPL